MTFLPKPPTDNIYKFAALSGTWILALIIGYYLFLGYLNLNLKKESVQQNTLFTSQSMIKKIDKRLLAIYEKRLEDDKLNWVPNSDGSVQEESFLKKQKEIHNKKVSKYQPLVQKAEFKNLASLLFKTGAHLVFLIFIPIGVFLVWQGYKQWYVRIQKPIDNQYKYDLEIKKLTIEKLNREIKKLKRKK